ncbi:MAG TPA: hypothetical protein V6D28_24355 [Leptolyngbyaceae cyanobacterium]
MSFQLIGQAKHLLLSGLITSISFSAMPVQAQVSDARVNAMVEALRQAAPPNKANDGMYSQWQVLPGIIPSWTKQCLGRELTPAQFESDATAARNTVACIVGRELSKQMTATNNNETASVRNVACWWMTGNAAGCSSGATGTYVQRVVGFYQQPARGNNTPNRQSASPQRSSANTQASSASTTTSSSPVVLVSDRQVTAMVEALRLAAPRTATPNDGLYSQWQVKPEIIPSWSKQCIGQELTPAQFETDSQAAQTVISCIMRRELNRQYSATNQNEMATVRQTACWWMTGNATACNGGATSAYVQRVLNLYQQQAQGNNSSEQQPSASQRQPENRQISASSSNTQVSDVQVNAVVEALRLAVAGNPIPEGLYSQWQVTPGVIPSWTKQCIGRSLTPAEFSADARAARNTVACIVRRELNRQFQATGDASLAVQRVAAWWLTGDASQYDRDRASEYSQKILNLYQQQIARAN